jgi:PAS domain S-box-containing protein
LADEKFARDLLAVRQRTDRMFLVLLLAQWVFGIVLALWLSPLTWSGQTSSVHVHLKIAIALGGAINLLPIVLILSRPGWSGTRHTVAFAQMLWSALLIHLTGGRIETHFHVFGSLAFLAFYRDWRVLLTATVVVAGDHLARGLLWPESVYGLANPEWWRFLEHAFWVVFEDIVLVFGCLRSLAEMRTLAEREAALEETNAHIEAQVAERTAELHASMERYRDLVENTGAVPWELDPQTDRFCYVAPAAAKRIGRSTDALSEPGAIDKLVHPEDRAPLRAAIARAAANPDEAVAVDYRVTGRDGKLAYISAHLSATPDGRIRALGLDVTRQRELERELRQAQKLESVGRLAAGVAHEINTPIQFIGDSVQFVRDATTELCAAVADHPALAAGSPSDAAFLATEIPVALDRALDGLGRVSAIVRSMKQVAYPERREMVATDLNDTLRSALTIARSEYRYVADVATDLGPLPAVTCHPGDINQVILNLVVNAAHAIADVVAGTDKRGTITIRTVRDGDDAVITLADDGCGMPEEIRERIFDPFFTTKEVGRGTGQGLSIARAIVVDTHKGSLTCESEAGRGTTFTVRLPIGGAAVSVEEIAA